MQQYENIEYVVQDGLSSDDTIKIFDEYRTAFGDKLRFISAADSCCEEGFWLALSRCQGEILCASLADEEILPDAIPYIVTKFQQNPDIDIIHGDIYKTDIDGNIQCRIPSVNFDLVDVLSHKTGLHLAASFFKKSAFEKAFLLPFPGKHGLLKDDYFTWAYLGLHCRIEYLPKTFAKYAIHESALSVDPKRIPGIMSGRSVFLDTFFETEKLPKLLTDNKKYILFNFYSYATDLLLRNKFYDEAQIYIDKRNELAFQADKLYFAILNVVRKCRRRLRRIYK
jgi:hypothetical protein